MPLLGSLIFAGIKRKKPEPNFEGPGKCLRVKELIMRTILKIELFHTHVLSIGCFME